MTVIAAATSLPDALVSVRAARDDEDVTSLTNVLGSNTFNLLVAIPVGVLLAGSATIDFLVAVPMMGFLAAATLVFIVFTRTDSNSRSPRRTPSSGCTPSFWAGWPSKPSAVSTSSAGSDRHSDPVMNSSNTMKKIGSRIELMSRVTMPIERG